MTTHVLILCTHNSARSVLGEGMLNHLAAKLGKDIKAHSAGSAPSGRLNPFALEALRNAGIDTGDYRSRDRKRGPTPEGFDPNSSSASSNSGDGSPWYSPGAKPAPTERVATAAQVQEAAKAKGWTVEQTKRWMRENGWSLR